jgi:hypothetical protein
VVVVERRAEDEVPRARRVVLRRPVREPPAAVPGRGSGGPAACARRGGGSASPGLEEPRVRDHVGQTELVPPHRKRRQRRRYRSKEMDCLCSRGLLCTRSRAEQTEAEGKQSRAEKGARNRVGGEPGGREAPFVLALVRAVGAPPVTRRKGLFRLGSGGPGQRKLEMLLPGQATTVTDDNFI